MPSDTPTWIQALGAIAQAVIALGALFISWLLWRTSKRHARVEYARQMADAWNQFNAIIIANPSLALSPESMIREPDDGDSAELVRQRYLTYTMLNIAAAAYAATGGDLMDLDDHAAEVERIVDVILLDDRAAAILYSGGYSPAFTEFCRRRHNALKRGRRPLNE